jgi:hypothetical protein
MDTQEQRKDALKLAIQANAPKTQAIIKEPNSTIETILKTAEAEVGLDKLIPIILENYPYWALGALRFLPNLGKYEAPLREKARIVFLPASVDAPTAANTASEATGLPTIDTFEMYLSCGMGYDAHFTMWYFTPPFSNTWTVSDKISGGFIPVCQSQTQKCTFFSMPKNPLKAGDTVMMVLGIAGNKDWVTTNILFTYDPNNLYTAQIDCHGQTLNPYFTFSTKGD